MAEDLTVGRGTTLVLDENPPAQAAGGFQQIHFRALNDLVDHAVIGSATTADALLEAAKMATAGALTRRETFTPFVPVVGTTRPDLRRYGSFLAAAPNVHPGEAQSFWRVARAINPTALASVALDTDLTTVGLARSPILSPFYKYLFNDVVIEPTSTLAIAPAVHMFSCNNLLIKKTGRIVVQSSGLKISAFSIQGEQ
jgi:hypothetical protein